MPASWSLVSSEYMLKCGSGRDISNTWYCTLHTHTHNSSPLVSTSCCNSQQPKYWERASSDPVKCVVGSQVTVTNSLPPQSRNGNTVVIAAELVGPFGTWSTGWTFPCRVWGRPTDSSTWRSMAWCAGMLSGNLATCPNMALRPLVIRSDTGARPVRKEPSELRKKSCHLIPRIIR